MNKSETTLPNSPFISLCITSYNRIDELRRCLESIDTSDYINLVEIVVSEDCSPRKNDIIELVNIFSNNTKYKVLFNSNAINLGYDCNLGKLISLASGKYILLINDDDALLEGALDKTIKQLMLLDCAMAFSPFYNRTTRKYERQFDNSFAIPSKIEELGKYIYCAILNSGLIFKRELINRFEPEKFKNLIYFQVYIFISVIYKYGGQYINIPLIDCFGDGENGFGISESSVKNPLLADRLSIYSNLEYHIGLIKVIRIFDIENALNIIKIFEKEYSLHSYIGMSKARISSKMDLKKYWNKMNNLDIEITWIAKVYYFILFVFGTKMSNIIIRTPKYILLKMRKKWKWRIVYKI